MAWEDRTVEDEPKDRTEEARVFFDAQNRKAFTHFFKKTIELKKRIKELEKELAAVKLDKENLKRILHG